MRSWRRWLGVEEVIRLAPADGYARWAPTYPPRAHNALMAAEQGVVVALLSGIRAGCALDVGTGTGRCLPLLEATGATRLVGVDLSLSMLAQGMASSRLVCADAGRLPFADGRFDLVSCSLMVGDFRRIDAWAGEMARVLVKGGHLVYSDFHPSWSVSNWRRTFRDGEGRQCELPYFPHAIEEHLDALHRAGLDPRAVREPRIEGRRSPVVAVFHAVKWR